MQGKKRNNRKRKKKRKQITDNKNNKKYSCYRDKHYKKSKKNQCFVLSN